MTHNRIAMQARCLTCLKEQYGFNIVAVSYGQAGCAWCGTHSREMTWDEYAREIAAAYAKALTPTEPTMRPKATE